MKANNTLKGQALHTYNRVTNAMAEDNETSMLHTFAALTQQAKNIVLHSGKFSNAYVRGEHKGMTAEEAAKDLTARAAACVTCKVRYIDIVITTAFLAEYISRQRKEIETPKPTTLSTSDTMNTETKTMNEVTKIYTDYKTAVNWLHSALVLCNNIVEVDPSVIDNARFAWYDEEEERETEVYQWFITDCSEDDVEFLESRFPGLLFTYSDMLDVYVLCVDHFGTPWSGVRIETTLENAAKENI